MRKYFCVAVSILFLFLLCGCGGKKPVKLELKSELDDTARTYFVGDEFDSTVDTENGQVSRIPRVFVLYDDGTSKWDDISFSLIEQ